MTMLLPPPLPLPGLLTPRLLAVEMKRRDPKQVLPRLQQVILIQMTCPQAKHQQQYRLREGGIIEEIR